MKRVGYLFEQICDYDNLRLAFVKARKGKCAKPTIVAYSKDVDKNLDNLRQKLKNGSFKPGNYNYFRIYDPKERLICAAAFEERVVHHAIMNVCKPIFERNLIYDTYATRNGKGVYKALDRARYGMRNYDFVGKFDVRKYFDSISHKILKNKLLRLFKDKELLSVFYKLIDSYEVEPECGIPIGNLTSQFFANYYLSSLDHYAKEQLKVPVYVRYMDDILVFANSRDDLRKYAELISHFVENQLQLQFKPVILNNVNHGVSFLGYKLFKNKILLTRRSKIRFKRKCRHYIDMFEQSLIDENKFKMNITPLHAFVMKAYTRRLRLKTINTSTVEKV